MKATKAYIASLGTTGVLLAASLLMLAIVSAVVAFDRWPGAGVASPTQTLILSEKPAAIRVSSHGGGPSATAVALRSAGALAGGPRTALAPVAGGRQLAGIRKPSAAPITPLPAVPAPVAKTLQPVTDTTSPIFDAVSNPGTAAGAVADGAQSVTDAAGVSVGRISPQVGGAVAGAGQAVAQTVRDLPLPQHIIPGH